MKADSASLSLPHTYSIRFIHPCPPLWTKTCSDQHLWYVKVPRDINRYGHSSEKVGLGQKHAPIWKTTHLIK